MLLRGQAYCYIDIMMQLPPDTALVGVCIECMLSACALHTTLQKYVCEFPIL